MYWFLHKKSKRIELPWFIDFCLHVQKQAEGGDHWVIPRHVKFQGFGCGFIWYPINDSEQARIRSLNSYSAIRVCLYGEGWWDYGMLERYYEPSMLIMRGCKNHLGRQLIEQNIPLPGRWEWSACCQGINLPIFLYLTSFGPISRIFRSKRA